MTTLGPSPHEHTPTDIPSFSAPTPSCFWGSSSLVKMQGAVFCQIRQEFPQGIICPEKKKVDCASSCQAWQAGGLLICLPGPLLKRHPCLPSAPVWAAFTRSSCLRQALRSYIGKLGAHRGIGHHTPSALGPPRPPGHLMKPQPMGSRAASHWAEPQPEHDCHRHSRHCSAELGTPPNGQNRCLSRPRGEGGMGVALRIAFSRHTVKCINVQI